MGGDYIKCSIIASVHEHLLQYLSAMQETLVPFLGQEDHWRRDTLLTPVFLGFPCGSAGKESTCNEGNLGLIPGLGRSPGEGTSYSLQYSGLDSSMDSIVRGVTKSWTQLSDFHFPSKYHLLYFHFLMTNEQT